MLCELTGAEAATVVNNNAAATVIILAALASGKEVILSRGQMVEIGGSFRIPTILEASGARLVEVGTTNRTYVDDYRRVIRPETGLLLSVHTSNYEIAGFSHHTSIEDLAALGRETALPVVSDLGSGCFVDLTEHGFRAEPLVSESVKAGADVVCFSGDKLLGGPQAGILVGRRELIEEIRAHPFFRAMRVDKMTLIALEATLRLYRDPETLAEKLPALGMIELKEPELRKRGDRFRRALLRRLQRGKSHSGKSPQVEVELIKESSQTGSGALPAQDLSTCAAAIALEGLSADELASRLRRYDPPIFTRIRNDRVLIDFRTLLDDEHKTIVEALVKIATSFSKD
jgi:L-seryl-tRNA(Ser) seleniumtransferase